MVTALGVNTFIGVMAQVSKRWHSGTGSPGQGLN